MLKLLDHEEKQLKDEDNWLKAYWLGK